MVVVARGAVLASLLLAQAMMASASLAPVKVVKAGRSQAKAHALWSRAGFETENSASPHLDERAVADWPLYNLGAPFVAPAAAGSNLERPFPERPWGSKRRANAFFAVDGVLPSEQQALAAKLPGASQLASVSVSDSKVDDSVALAASLARGVASREHGVVARSFPLTNSQGVASAFHDGAWPCPRAFPAAADAVITDAVRHAGPSMPAVTVVSASSDFALSAAFAANPRTAALIDHAAAKASATALFWDSEREQTASIFAGAAAPVVSRSAVLARAQGADSFDAATDAADFAFFAELELLRVATEAAVSGGAADKQSVALLFFTFATVRDLTTADKRAAALELVASAVKDTLATLDQAYGEADAQVFMADTADADVSFGDLAESEINAVYGGAKDDESRKYFERFFPMLYADKSGDSVHLCERVTATLSAVSQYEVECAELSTAAAAARAAAESGDELPALSYDLQRRQNLTTGGLLGETSDDSIMANIILWIGIALYLTVYAAVYAIYSMDVGRDDMIYRLTDIRDQFKLDRLS